MTMKLRPLLVLVAMLAMLLSQTAPSFSTAAFTSSSSTGESRIQASPDWTPPEVSMEAPGVAVKDTVIVSAKASDVDSQIRSVSIEQRGPNASGWTQLCTATKAPYSCTWNTKDGDDGAHSLRAVATDTHGNTATSELVSTAVANKLTVVLATPNQFIRGNAALSTTLHNAGATPYRVSVEFAPTGTTQWASVCTNLSSPYTCMGNTTALADGEYDLRATATAGDTSTRSEIVRRIRVDNTAPSVSMGNPGSPLKGTHTFTSTATDSGSGVAQVRMQYAATGSSAWQDLCTDTSAPYSCSYDTKKLTDGSYSFRAVATDRAGNTSTSATVANRIIENTVSTVTMTNPGSTLAGSVALSAQAASTAGVQSVQIQQAPSGSSSWTTVCTLTQSPYTCDWESRSMPNGQYSFRAVLTDGNGKETISAIVTGSRVSNPLMQATDIDATNGGRSLGTLDAGDRLTYSFSDLVDLGSVSSGWNGNALPVTVTVRNGGSLGNTVEVSRNGTPVNLGRVDLQNVRLSGTSIFNARMSASTTTVNGAPRSTITVTIVDQISGNDVERVLLFAPNATWIPSASTLSTYGVPMSTESVDSRRNRF